MLSALGPATLGQSGIHIRQSSQACITTITYMHVLIRPVVEEVVDMRGGGGGGG